jgi:ferrous iron transport protein B
MRADSKESARLLEHARKLRSRFNGRVHERVTTAAYTAAEAITADCVRRDSARKWNLDARLDHLLTSRLTGIPVMLGLLGFVFWLTISGANVPSAFLAGILMEEGGLSGWLAEYLSVNNTPAFLSVSLYEILHGVFKWADASLWLSGFLVDGVYLGLAWVVSVMLPPMTIFFPLFTILEDLGYLPRVAFNMDRFLKAAGAHGKQALTMAMGFGCNAAGVIACRIIESPRERLIAILTNNFVPCNGRWPTLIMMTSLFVAASFSVGWASVITVTALVATTLAGVAATLAVSFFLSRTLLKGVASSFMLEMPPFRPPRVGRVLYTSFMDRTLFVLWRAVICAAPAGGLIWLLGAIPVEDISAFSWLREALDPFGRLLGLDGVILIAFIFAIPANEIVVPTIIMGYMQTSRMIEIDSPSMLFIDNGWTLLTAVCLILFSLLHYPCTTTTLTIWKETRSLKWTALSNLIPLVLAVGVCFVVAQFGRLLGIV